MKKILIPLFLAAFSICPLTVRANDAPAVTSTAKKTSITLEELVTIAKNITSKVDGELTWTAIPKIMSMAADQVTDAADLDKAARKAAIVQVIDQVIDYTDTPHLPDNITDPIFKAMVPAFVDVFSDDDVLDGFDFRVSDAVKADQNYKLIAQEITAHFSKKFQWSDLLFALKVAIKFVGEAQQLDKNGKADMIKHILDAVIDVTDFPHLPDALVDPIFKVFVDAVVDEFTQYL